MLLDDSDVDSAHLDVALFQDSAYRFRQMLNEIDGLLHEALDAVVDFGIVDGIVQSVALAGGVQICVEFQMDDVVAAGFPFLGKAAVPGIKSHVVQGDVIHFFEAIRSDI